MNGKTPKYIDKYLKFEKLLIFYKVGQKVLYFKLIVSNCLQTGNLREEVVNCIHVIYYIYIKNYQHI